MKIATARSGFATALFLCFMAMMMPARAGTTDYLGVPGPIAFDGTDYALAWSSKPTENYVKQEYVPAGQDPKTFEQMLLLERVTGDVKVLDAARSQVDILGKRKGTDPLVRIDLLKTDTSDEVLLDFLVSAKDDKGEYIVEWNAYRYAPLRDGPGVLLFAVTHRAYGNGDAKAFLARLKQFRPSQIKALTSATLPTPTK